jgi:ATP-dependent DNA helicase PIF1
MNLEQSEAFAAVTSGKNVFITGPAGTGKSFIIDHIRQWGTQNNRVVTVTALTGCASVLIGGRTLHSALGIGLAQGNINDITSKIITNPSQATKIRKLDILIIDEISMMSNILFEKINGVLSNVRNNPLPFGGVQVVLCGDFCQLPPVSDTYCFKSNLWGTVINTTVVLKTLMRQLNDNVFQGILTELRMGECSAETFEHLKNIMQTEEDAERNAVAAIQPTVLYSLRNDVDRINVAEYKALLRNGCAEKTYISEYGTANGRPATALIKTQAKKWGDNIGILEKVSMCIGTQVVVTANIDIENAVINGTRGVVTQLLESGVVIQLLNGNSFLVELKRLVDDTNRLAVLYIPLQYAWALTINKSQGMTLDKAMVDLGSSVFASGQAYTALSRVRDLSSVRLMGLSKRSFMLHPDVVTFYRNN